MMSHAVQIKIVSVCVMAACISLLAAATAVGQAAYGEIEDEYNKLANRILHAANGLREDPANSREVRKLVAGFEEKYPGTPFAVRLNIVEADYLLETGDHAAAIKKYNEAMKIINVTEFSSFNEYQEYFSYTRHKAGRALHQAEKYEGAAEKYYESSIGVEGKAPFGALSLRAAKGTYMAMTDSPTDGLLRYQEMLKKVVLHPENNLDPAVESTAIILSVENSLRLWESGVMSDDELNTWIETIAARLNKMDGMTRDYVMSMVKAFRESIYAKLEVNLEKITSEGVSDIESQPTLNQDLPRPRETEVDLLPRPGAITDELPSENETRNESRSDVADSGESQSTQLSDNTSWYIAAGGIVVIALAAFGVWHKKTRRS